MRPGAIVGAAFGAWALTAAAAADTPGSGEPAGPAATPPAAVDRFEPARPFLFTTTTDRPADGRWTAYYATGYAERADVPFGYGGLEQRIGMQGALGHGFTLLGEVGLGLAGGTGTQSTQEAELLKDLLGEARGLRLAVGLGMRREWEGTKALLGRISLGHAFGRSALHGNLRLERPFAEGRDGVDIITTLGWLRRVSPAVGLGVEAMGEDLEGFWDPEEAEGGARLFGPFSSRGSARAPLPPDPRRRADRTGQPERPDEPGAAGPRRQERIYGPTVGRLRVLRALYRRSLTISRAAFAPGPPVTPPPGCVPAPQR